MKNNWQTVQQKHIVSTVDQDSLLVGSGIEKTIPYILSNDFAYKAKKDGIVESYDEKTGIVTLLYKDNTKESFDISNRLSKNSGGGFYNCQNFELLYKVGEKFKANDVIAKNPKFFSGDGKKEDISYTYGKLAKIAITSGDFSFEDSSMISSELAEKMSTLITMKKDITLGCKSNVSSNIRNSLSNTL